jgi:bifunctional non-homologous end joining protein LigD
MPLDTYREKRDFGRTPEPAGTGESTAPARAPLAFAIQKHAATRLHYDFRLERGGVLVSWAVPKGPSYDTRDKRLAVHVEDHPIEYGGFEGTIPAGEYGGGTVMLWDRGTYEPLVDFDEGLKAGNLKFALHGEKLTGRWALVRMKPRPGEKSENWLLIKERDEFVRPREEYDVVEALPDSVATGRTMAAIAQGADVGMDPGTLPAARAGQLEPDLPVQLATLVEQPPEGEEWLHEVKYDGYRIRAALDRGSVRLLTRTGQDWTDRFEPIARAIESLPLATALLDGEVVALDTKGAPDFGALQRALSEKNPGRLVYMAFDLLHADGWDLRDVALEKRKEALRAYLEAAGPTVDSIRYVDHITGSGSAFHAQACELALEGSVSKRLDRPYREGRTRDWLKVKCLHRQEFVVTGWTEPRGSRTGFGALLLGVYEDGVLRHAGRVGTGFTAADLAEISARLHPLATDEAPFDTPPDLRRVPHHWVEPELIAEVSFQEWTREGVARHPSFVGLREDKPATDVAEESPGRNPGVAVAGVTITNPDKELYPTGDSPGNGITKLELARYYERVATHMLPHIGGRPLTLVRCPHGQERACFYQKHPDASGFPGAVKSFELTEHGKLQRYMYVDSLEGLLALVQLGALELHAWNSQAADPELPDRIVFDLDPGPGVGWTEVRDAALFLREALASLELPAFVKTTGGWGLHVVVPIAPERDHDEVREFAHALVTHLATHEPDRFTAKMAKDARGGRIFIDYLRNAHGATAIASYSTRARPGVPVSVPLSWEELDRDLDPLAFDTRSVPVRLESQLRDPWVGYEHERAELTTALYAALEVPRQGRL